MVVPISILLMSPFVAAAFSFTDDINNLLKGVQHLGEAFGFPNIGSDLLRGNPTEGDVLNKFRALIAGAQSHTLDQNSYAAMRDFASALPGMNLTPEANAEVMANLLAIGQKPRDMAQHAQDYVSRESGSPVTHTYAGLIPDYNQKFPGGSYTQMTSSLKKLFYEQPKLAADLVETHHDPRVQAALLKKFGYNPGLSRVFQ